MKKSLLVAFSVGFLFSSAATVSATEYVPEPPKNQKAVYNEVDNKVVLTAVAPKYTEYNWETYEQSELPYISYILIERHTPGTAWGDNPEIGRVENPAVGQEFSYVDADVTPDAKYEYRLTCYVDQTKGQYSSFVSVYTGVTPGALKDFMASVVDHTSNVVDFEVTAPETSISGAPLTTNCVIDIQEYVDWTYTTIHTIEDVAPGQTCTWHHVDREINKSYHYRALARIGSTGNGEAMDADVYVGLDLPGQPVDFLCVPEGEGARLTWSHSVAGARGGNFFPEETVYRIVRVYNDGTEELAANVKGTTYLDVPGFDEACTISYTIIGTNEAGEGYKDAVHPAISFGKPALLPFKESFENQKMEHRGWVLESTQDDEYYTYQAWEFPSYGKMYYFPDDSYLDIPPYDNDGGLASCRFYGYCPDGQRESLISPEINVEGVKDAILTFCFFDVMPDASMNSVAVSVSKDGGDWEQIYASQADEMAEPGWLLEEVPVSLENKCTTMRMRFDAIRHEGPITNVYFDNINLKADQAGVETVATDETLTEGVAEYFTLQGVRLQERPSTAGVYLVKRGSKVVKEIVKF